MFLSPLKQTSVLIQRQIRVHRRLIAFAFIIGTCITSNAQQPNTQTSEAKTGSISGRIVNESGQPLMGAAIYVRSVGTSTGRTAFSDLEGNFQVNGLASALYYVSGVSPAYVSPPLDTETTLPTYRVGDSVRLVLIRGGVVTGTVTNAASEPVVGVRVRAFMVRDATGKSNKGAVLSLGERLTDDRGIYRIYGLAPGTYLVQAGGGGEQQSVNATDFDAPTFAPSSTRDTAAEIQVRGGEETTVDIRYRVEQGHAVSGTVKTESPFGASISLTHAGDGVVPTSSTYQPPGVRGFVIYGVADGEYELTAQRTNAMASMAYPEVAISEPVRVTVKGADVTGLELIPKPLGSIAGRIALEQSKVPECENKRRPLFSETMIALVQNRKQNKTDQLALMRLIAGSTVPDKEGAFVIRNIRQGQYSFSSRFFARYWYLKSMSIGPAAPSTAPAKTATALSKDAARNWTPVKSGDRLTGLTITLSEGAASVRGQLAKAENTKLDAGFRVYFIPSERDKLDDPLRYFTSEVGGDGTFSLNNLPPGRYWTLAQQPEPDTPTTTEKLRLPDAIESRAKIRRAAETVKSEVELKPCQNLIDYKLRLN